MRILFILICSLVVSLGGYAQMMTAEQYIETYKDIAIAEMKRTGVPASITLAQGLIESANGNSSLSKQSNNHFGIKCKKEWTGRFVNYDDDAPQECFRAYDRAEDSYRDHSDFLRAGTRYAFLFELEPTDYKGWAKGLKEAGYATNPQYTEMLVTAIEKYGLYQYDAGNKRVPFPLADGNQRKEPLFGRNGDDEITSFNGIRAYEVKEGDTYLGITDANFMMRWEIAKYNEIDKNAKLEPGTILYLKPKLRKAKEEYHVVKPGESMYYISQLHAVKLKVLYKLNKMSPGQEPAVGEKLSLRSKRDEAPKLSTRPVEKKPLKRPEPPKKEPEIIEPEKEALLNEQPPVLPKPEPVEVKAELQEMPKTEFHVVNAGETLYSIARKYNVTVESLKTANNLTDNTLSIGQKLVIR
jgi:LysM repeat protein